MEIRDDVKIIPYLQVSPREVHANLSLSFAELRALLMTCRWAPCTPH